VSVKAISVTKLATAALLFGAIAMGCAGHNGGAAPSPGTPAVQQSQVAGTAPTLEPITSDAPSDSPESSATTDPGVTAAPGSTTDPIDTDLSQIENQLNGVNGSLSGADAGPSAGE
jgi:hypothetical protein